MVDFEVLDSIVLWTFIALVLIGLVVMVRMALSTLSYMKKLKRFRENLKDGDFVKVNRLEKALVVKVNKKEDEVTVSYTTNIKNLHPVDHEF